MILVRGRAGGTALTGTVYEPTDDPPSFAGAPDPQAPYVWVCDAFYAVESGGIPQEIDGSTVRVAFEPPFPQPFQTRTQALTAAEDHLRTQFVRVGIDSDAVEIERIEDVDPQPA